MQKVAASEARSLGNLEKITFRVLKTSIFIDDVDHKPLSSAAAQPQLKIRQYKSSKYK